jgi:hypothetical protein
MSCEHCAAHIQVFVTKISGSAEGFRLYCVTFPGALARLHYPYHVLLLTKIALTQVRVCG